MLSAYQAGPGTEAGPGVGHLLRSLGLSPRKALGQHFLISPGVLSRILAAAELSRGDLAVEVGPGLGILTRALEGVAGRVVAVEADPALAAALGHALANTPAVRVVAGDALTVDLEEMVPPGAPYKVVANLPYYAANAIIRRFLEADHRPTRLVVMVQREVARQMAAAPGRMSLLSVAVQLYGVPRIVSYVLPGSFYPPPKVTSAIVRIDVRQELALAPEERGRFFSLVRAGFAAPRKQLRGALSRALGRQPEEVEEAMASAGLAASQRAGALSVNDWLALYGEAGRRLWTL